MFKLNHESLLAPNKLNHSTLFVLFLNIKKKSRKGSSGPVLPFLAIYRQIRDFGLLFGDGKFELAIDRQTLIFRDFEPVEWRNRRILNKTGDIGEF